MQKLGLLGAAIAVILGFYFLSRSPDITPQLAEQQLMNNASSTQAEMFGVIKEAFPQDYENFLGDLSDLQSEGAFASDTDGQMAFAFSQGFFTDMRLEHARYLATAPFENIREIREASAAVLDDLSGEPTLCAIYAFQGGGGFSLEQASQIDADLLMQTAIVTFKAMAAGRDTPVEHAEATQSDINQVLELWRGQPDVDTNDWLALVSGNMDDPRACAANLSFERFMLQHDDPLVQRVVVYLTALSHQI